MLPESVTPPQEHAEALGASGTLAVSRIWPRGEGRLSLELVSATGVLLAGQWFAEEADRDRIAHATRGRALRPEHAVLSSSRDRRGEDAGTVLVQAHGADRRLRALPGLLADPATTLLLHRPERRAVVHRRVGERDDGDGDGRAGGEFLRVFRPGRTAPAVSAAETANAVIAGIPDLTAPVVQSHLTNDGVVVTRALPGRSLRDSGDTGAPDALAGARGIGRLLRRLAQAPHPAGLLHRDVNAELAWVGTWLTRVGHYLPQVHTRLTSAFAVVAGHLDRTTPSVPGVVHGDLHDGQVLVTADGGLGVLDWDTVAIGEGALDAANVWAHTDLRRLLGQWSGEHAGTVWDAVGESWVPRRAELERAAAYRRLLLLRLACQYAFRPAHEHVVDALADLATA